MSDLLALDARKWELSEQLGWFVQIFKWVFRAGEKSSDARLRYLIQLLERNAKWDACFLETLTSVLERADFLKLFTEIDLAVDLGLWGDTWGRFLKKILPRPANLDFRESLLDVVKDAFRVSAFEAVKLETWGIFAKRLYRPDQARVWSALKTETGEALIFLSAHVAHYGLSGEIHRRSDADERASRSPFLRLQFEVLSGDTLRVQEAIKRCQAAVSVIYQSLEGSGVSVGVVNRLETVTSLLDQIARVSKLNADSESPSRLAEITEFIHHAALSGIRRRAVLGHVRLHFYLLSKKITERNGVSGEHYIARDLTERKKLFVSAIGGGAIVVVMTVAKSLLIQAELPPLFLAIGFWFVYSSGFLVMQFAGATLATKIPSFTASRLACLLLTVKRERAHEFRDEFRSVMGSQVWALIGNVVGLMALIGAYTFFMRLTHIEGHTFQEPYARHVLEGLHPFKTFALFLAALTGWELWLSSVAGGWFENWIVFNRLPEAIRFHSRLRSLFGEKICGQLADWIGHHSSGFAANISLGFLFGFVPLLGVLIGIDLSGHHVTISSSAALMAMSSLDFSLSWQDISWVVLGLLGVGIMNFTVSFGVALYVAALSQRMRFSRVLLYLRKGSLDRA